MNISNQKGHYSVKDKGLISENLEGIGGIRDSYSKEYVFKKTDRIVSALYAVTRHLKDSEPAKGSVREGAVELVRLITLLDLAEDGESGTLLARIGAIVLRMVTLLEALTESFLISRENCAILRKELLLFVRFVVTLGTGSSLRLDTQTFAVPFLKRGKRGDVRSGARSEGSDSSVIKDINQEKPVGNSGVEDNVIKDKIQNSSRTEAISSLLKTKSDLMVKDFLTVLPGISEKTIQRELSVMVARGIIKKSGLRRWTRYSIVS